MKVYELMNELSKCSAGAEVKIHLLRTLDEMPVYEDEDLREVDSNVGSVDGNDYTVYLSD
jgi:hypothetical protein